MLAKLKKKIKVIMYDFCIYFQQFTKFLFLYLFHSFWTQAKTVSLGQGELKPTSEVKPRLVEATVRINASGK